MFKDSKGSTAHHPGVGRHKRKIVVALAATAVVLIPVASAAVAASPGTQQRIYHAFTATGKPSIRVTRTVRGFCNGGSDAIVRSDAWRCFFGHMVADPCFSSDKANGIVLCPAAAWERFGVKIKLTKALPTSDGWKVAPSKSGKPWGIRTTSGLNCSMTTGATSAIGRRRANYACGGGQWLWGAPERKYTPWKIYVAPVTAHKLTRQAEIGIAWF